MRKLRHKDFEWLVQGYSASSSRRQMGIWHPEPNAFAPFPLRQVPLLLIVPGTYSNSFCRIIYAICFSGWLFFSLFWFGGISLLTATPGRGVRDVCGALSLECFKYTRHGRNTRNGVVLKLRQESALDKTPLLVLQRNPPTLFKST